MKKCKYIGLEVFSGGKNVVCLVPINLVYFSATLIQPFYIQPFKCLYFLK